MGENVGLFFILQYMLLVFEPFFYFLLGLKNLLERCLVTSTNLLLMQWL